MNVHPTKASVNFLDEEIIIESIADSVQSKLAERGSSSRTFGVQVSQCPHRLQSLLNVRLVVVASRRQPAAARREPTSAVKVWCG